MDSIEEELNNVENEVKKYKDVLDNLKKKKEKEHFHQSFLSFGFHFLFLFSFYWQLITSNLQLPIGNW